MLTNLIYKGINVSFSDEGKGAAVILLHGFLENSTMWKNIQPELIKRNRVITIDLLGHGKTGCLGYVHTMEMMADVVHVVLSHLKIRKSIFIGHSMGGYVALAFAEMHPDKLKGLVLLNSTARGDSEERKILRERANQAVHTNYENLVKMSIGNLFRPKSRAKFSKEISVVKKEALQTPIQGYIAAQEGMSLREDREVLLSFSPYKKLMFIAEKDPVLDLNDALSQVEGTSVQKIILPDGHMSHIENHEEVLSGLLKFLKSIR